ncbi:ribosome biogenesis GTPase Der [Pseudomarimonas salicorniae]|uniref:GTPase Der n=1 Tax=Pseudomarimonas salicorniae TaxID=2933270 RepID=A0ABT0GFL0_9GAMM|nr:ribosome biogenesis GTPase Der [Lysobacter sp. CAU 1642]MCK7592979.1 ribosome biogenesis GTPase Der [Lysobacter sp. CAU 1642]
MLPMVALVGRPNVGKSTLFNALTRSRDALVANQPGVTRDRQFGICRLLDNPFLVVDTGGLSDDPEGLAGLTSQQSMQAMQEAAVIAIVVDARDGVLSYDHQVVADARRCNRPMLLLVNKTDGLDADQAMADFSVLGVQPAFAVAASHQRGLGPVLEELAARLPEPEPGEALDQTEPDRMRLAIVGRPNVGKSTLVNRLLGEERVIASDVPGTTRDAIAVDLERDGHKYRLIDTAGIRRRARVEEAVEKFSVLKTLQAIESAQVVVMLLDAREGVTDQDSTVLGQVLESGRGLVVCLNKWDGLDEYQREQCRNDVSRKLAFVEYAQVLTLSAKHGSGIRELFRAVHKTFESATRQFSTSELTRAIEAAYEALQPPVVRGHVAKLRYAHPGGTNPPTVVIHGTRVASLPQSYKRYLENFLRRRFKLVGTPLRLEFRAGANPYEGKKNELTDKQVKQRKRLIRHVKRR